METSPLPRFPDSTPRNAPEEDELALPSGRALLLRFLFLVIFWGSVYILYQKALVFTAASERMRAREQEENERSARIKREREEQIKNLEGKWQPIQGGLGVLEIRTGEMTIWEDGKLVGSGHFKHTFDRLDSLDVQLRDASGKVISFGRFAREEDLSYEATENDLSLRGWSPLLDVLGAMLRMPVRVRDEPLRFRRVKE